MVGLFENVVAVLPIVICFQSLVLDMAGNVGTQSLAVTIRVLMDENLTGKQKFQLVVKEVKTGSLNGILLGVMALLCLGIYVHFFKGYTWMGAFGISGCVGVSLLVAMAISSAVGTVIPMFFHKIKVDPAVASGPPDHHSKRSGGGSDLLWNGMVTFDPVITEMSFHGGHALIAWPLFRLRKQFQEAVLSEASGVVSGIRLL